MKKLKVAIVGCGWVAGNQFENGFAQLRDLFDVVACCEIDEARLAAFAAKYGVAKTVSRYADLLDMADIDVVSICTPPSEHHAMVRAALAAGKHALCEKPFTSSLELMDDIIAAQKSSSARVMPIFQYRYGPGFERARALVRSGLGGKLYVSAIETAWLRGAVYYQVPWRGKFATELGGVLVTQSIHIHDLFMCLAGPVAKVAAFKATRVNPIEVEDCAVASLQMSDGSLASLTATLGSARPSTRMRFCFENFTIERHCFDLDAPKPALEPWTVVPMRPELQRDIDAATAGLQPGDLFFAGQFRSFHRSVVEQAPFDITLEDSRRSLELITAIYSAAETGTVESLPIDRRHARYKGWS
ncbi:MAG: Gfo/Idh/MocA family oxidoreductase [Telmatospirillum sp.]|nr:Gfo/Idh/MocA family oxidoreductase [Telmatospirillum sp.]